MNLPAIVSLSFEVLHVSERTNWSFVALQTSDGQTSWGEASLNGWEPMQQGAVAMLHSRLVGLPIDQAMSQLTVSAQAPGGLVYASVISALAQAYLEWQAWHRQQAWHEPLAGLQRDRIRAYANINRTTTLRSPEGFVASARRAQAQGFTAFKAAPFDHLTPALCGTAEGLQYLHHGITCLLALRDAIGPEPRLMVDCHWRMDELSAVSALRDLAPARLHWFECPLPEVSEHAAALLRLKRLANEQGVLTAGAETLIGLQGFQPLFDAGTYDVVMPDVKYCGGPWAMLQIARCAHEAGVRFSPHNPTGPLASLHSLNVAAVAPECDMVELQFDETPFFEDVLPGIHPLLQQGDFAIAQAAGLRARLKTALFQQHPYQAVGLGIETLAVGATDSVV